MEAISANGEFAAPATSLGKAWRSVSPCTLHCSLFLAGIGHVRLPFQGPKLLLVGLLALHGSPPELAQKLPAWRVVPSTTGGPAIVGNSEVQPEWLSSGLEVLRWRHYS